MKKRAATILVLAGVMVAPYAMADQSSTEAAQKNQQSVQAASGPQRQPDEVARELIGQNRIIQQLEKQREQLKLQAEIQEYANELAKAQHQRQQIGKEPEREKDQQASPNKKEDIVYYPPPANQNNANQSGESSKQDDESESSGDGESQDQGLKGELKKASIVRTFRPVEADQREAVIRLRSSQVPVTMESQFGDWKVSSIRSEVVTFKHVESGESVVIGF